MQEVRSRTYKVLLLLVNIRFQVLFHSPLGVLFTFPSLYLFTIGHQKIFSLGRWSSRIPTAFHVHGGTWDTSRILTVAAYRAITLFHWPFQTILLNIQNSHRGPATPFFLAEKWFRLFPLRSPLLRESL